MDTAEFPDKRQDLLERIDQELPKIFTFAAMDASTGRLLLESLAYIIGQLPAKPEGKS